LGLQWQQEGLTQGIVGHALTTKLMFAVLYSKGDNTVAISEAATKWDSVKDSKETK